MAFKRGDKKPDGSGRKKGTPNKSSLRVVEDLERASFNPVAEYLKAVRAIEDPEKRLTAIARLFRYCYPRLTTLDPLALVRELEKRDAPAAAGADISSSSYLKALLALASTNEPGPAANSVEPSSGA